MIQQVRSQKHLYSSKNFTDSVHYRARDLGRLIGVEFAEGYTSERSVAIEDLDKLI